MKTMQDLMAPGVPEQATNSSGPHAGIHLDEIGAAGEEERHAGFTGYRTGEQRLAGAGRADEQNAFGNVSADCREPIGVAKEVDDFLHLVLGFVDARDVLEGDHAIAALGDACSARIWNPAGRGPIHREADQAKERGDGENHAVAERLRVVERTDFDPDVFLDEIVDERRVRREEFRGGHGLHRPAVAQRDLDVAFAEGDLRNLASIDLLEELGKCQRRGLRCTLDIVNAGRDRRDRDDREDRQHHEAWAAEARWQHELHPFREVQPDRASKAFRSTASGHLFGCSTRSGGRFGA